MANYLRKGLLFLLRGLVLSRPINRLDTGEVALARNIRSYQATSIIQRPGQTAINATALTPVGTAPIHTIRRMNDEISGAANPFLRIVGAGTGLYAGTTFTGAELTAIATGFSGNPLSLIPHRPTQSPEPFMYVGDANKMGKVKDDRTFRNMGIAPPTTPPTGPGSVGVPSLNSFQFTTIETGITAAAGWTVDATVITSVANGTGPTDTMTAVLFDTGTTGWASVVTTPSDARFYQAGFMIATNTAAETVIMETVYKAVKTTTIAAITYDSGTTGLCTIQLAAHKRKALVPNSIILINSGGGSAEYVRVLSVSFGNDDVPSLRCSTVNNHAAAETITGVVSWRAFFANNHAAAETYTFRVLAFSSASFAAGAGGTGYGNKVSALDLSSVAGRAIQDDDELNFIIYIDTEKVCSEIQVMLGLDAGFGNYYFITIRPSDFTSIAGTSPSSTTVTAKAKKIQLDQVDQVAVTTEATRQQIRERLQRRLAKSLKNGNIDRSRDLQRQLDELNFGPGSDIGNPPATPADGQPSSVPIQVGVGQYVPVRVKVKNVARVGTDFTKGWADVAAIRVRISVDNQSGGTTTLGVNFGSFWIGGSFGPDIGEIGTPYIYRYRYRASESGSISAPSPATRSGVSPKRQRVQLTAVASADAQVDKIDWFRFGGTINDWRYIGTAANATTTFNDDFPDDSIGSERLRFDRYQPFPVVDLPRTGVCNASGTAVSRTSGDNFNTSWAPGSLVIVNGVPATIYRVISTTLLETVENLGALASVSFFLPQPLIQGQPLPAMWGPFIDSDGAVRFLACGATSQAGTLFITTGNDPDSAPAGVVGNEITSPSEPLINGCIYDGRAWVFSDHRLFHIQIGGVPDALGVVRSTIRFQEVPNSRGLFARFGLCVTPQGIVFIAADGIYITNGGQPESITDADLYPLFPHDGSQAGATTGGVAPPDFSLPNQMGLDYGDGLVKFWFTDTGAVRRTLVRNMMIGGWQSIDTYNVPISCHHYEEGRGLHSELGGGTDGRLYTLTGTTDAGAAITSIVRLAAEDDGDSRAQKKYGDCTLDYTAATGVSATIGFDDYVTLLTPQALGVKAARKPPVILDINTGSGQEGVNIALDITWMDATAVLYEWTYSLLTRPEKIQRRITDEDDLGFSGPKYIRGLTLEADTFDVVKDIAIQGDTGAFGLMVTQSGAGTLSSIRHNGRSRIDYAFSAPFIAHQVRALPGDADLWRLYDWQFIFDPYPPLTALITAWTNAGWDGPKWLEGIRLTADTANLPVNIVIQYDGEQNGPTIPVMHNGQVTIDYSLASPIIAHNFRVVPQGAIRIFQVEYIWEKEAPLVTNYISQVATDDMKNFCHIRDGEFGYISTADITLTLVLDGVSQSPYTLPNSGGVFVKEYMPFAPIKFKTRQYKFDSAEGFRLYRRACWVRMKPWAGNEYQRVNAFGESHAQPTDGAII